MKILVFSLGVVFKNAVQGGSQKVLLAVSKGLANKGHTVTIVCPKREDNGTVFDPCPGVVVKPILPLRGAFPMPYAVSPFALTETCRIVEKELEDADLLYCHDGGLNIEFLKRRIPTVISLRDFCYPETLMGALNFQEKAIVVNSMHTFRCLQDSFVRVNPALKGKIKIIYNGYNAEDFYRKSISPCFYETYGLPTKTDELMIGFPHRPELSKGFLDALQVLRRLTSIFGRKVKLLVPVYMDKGLSDRTDHMYMQVKTMIDNMQLQDNVIYHNWVRHEQMPEYYSYCDVVLCIGNFVESFSNVSVEALLCGTPVVAANTSTYRTMPIRRFLRIVPYGAIDETVAAIREIRNKNNSEMLSEARSFIIENLSEEKMIDTYEMVFLNALENQTVQQATEVKCLQPSGVLKERYKLAAWCEVRDGAVYDDYRGTYFQDPFGGAFNEPDVTYTRHALVCRGISEEVIDQAVLDGLLVTDKE